MDEHVAALCREYNIKRTVKVGRGHAKVKQRKIQHQPITGDEMAYFVALHEIGHVVVGLGRTRLHREAEAWKWALNNAIIEPHYSTRQRICACLWRYVIRAQQHGWMLPEPGEDFWRLMMWWEPALAQDAIYAD